MAKKKTTKSTVPVQLELFNAMNYIAVDTAIEHLREVAEPHILQATTMQRYGMVAPETVFSRLVGSGSTTGQYQNWNLCGVDAQVTPKRLRTFKDQLSCVCCGREGNVFLVERHRNDNSTQYLNLYSISASGMVLMTVDHILPDSMGGRYDSANFQTMCRLCNQAKQNMMSEDEVALVRSNPSKYCKAWMPHGYLNILLDLQVMMGTVDSPKHKHRLVGVFDRYRKKVKHNTKEQTVKQFTVALLEAIEDAHPDNHGEGAWQNSSAARARARASIRGSWSVRLKRWFASAVAALVTGRTAAVRSRAESRSLG